MKTREVVFVLIAIVMIFLSGYWVHHKIYTSKQSSSVDLLLKLQAYKGQIDSLVSQRTVMISYINSLELKVDQDLTDTLIIYRDHEKNISDLRLLPADAQVKLLGTNLAAKDRN